MKNLGLGRIRVEDDRDKEFLMSSSVPKDTKKTFKYWCPNLWWGNQGNTPQCVGYSWTHWLAEGPKTQYGIIQKKGMPFNPSTLYYEAQRVDDWIGEDYAGTSVRAGAKVLRTHGFISAYYWAWTVDDIINSLLTLGPVVVGTNWTEGMFYPSEEHIIFPTGKIAGGHAYLLDGISLKKGLIRIKNSWGRAWGNKGFAYISIDDVDTLIRANGEACIATEINKI